MYVYLLLLARGNQSRKLHVNVLLGKHEILSEHSFNRESALCTHISGLLLAFVAWCPPEIDTITISTSIKVDDIEQPASLGRKLRR